MKEKGRPKAKIDTEVLNKLAAMQFTLEEIANWFGVNKSTISRRFATNIIKGKSSGKISLRRAMYTKALEGNVVMQIWLSKQYLGMKERVETSEEAKPLPWIDQEIIMNENKFKEYIAITLLTICLLYLMLNATH